MMLGVAVLLSALNTGSLGQAQMIVAHRGASADAPENTLAAFRLAWEQRADAIEGDFYLTADQQIVALHDKTTGRTTGAAVEWDVREKTLEALRTLDVGQWKAEAFANEKIPTLAEVAATIPSDKKLVLEIKDSARIVPTLKQQFSTVPELKALLPDRCIIIAFDEQVIAACKASMPEIQAMWLTSFREDKTTGEMKPSIEQVLETLKRIKADGLDCQASEHIDQAFVEKLRAQNFQFHVWTVDLPAVAQRFKSLGVDSITTNKPAFLRDKVLADAAVTAQESND